MHSRPIAIRTRSGPASTTSIRRASPLSSEMASLLTLARQRLSDQQLWINPDCGLKTRSWEEVRPALVNMVAAAKQVRAGA